MRAILAALSPAERAAVAAAMLAWCRALAALAADVAAGLARPAAAGRAEATTRALLADVEDAPGAAVVAPFAPVCAIVGAWWATGAHEIARCVAERTAAAGDFADALAFLAELGDGRALDAPPAPRVVRCPMPAPDGDGAPPTLAEVIAHAAAHPIGPRCEEDGPAGAWLVFGVDLAGNAAATVLELEADGDRIAWTTNGLTGNDGGADLDALTRRDGIVSALRFYPVDRAGNVVARGRA